MTNLNVSLPIGEKLFGSDNTFTYGIQENSLGELLGNLIGLLLVFALISFLIYFIVGGVRWLSAGGDPNKVESARNYLVNSFIGLMLTMAGWAIWLLVNKFFGLNLTQ